jgi:hypothetical protein
MPATRGLELGLGCIALEALKLVPLPAIGTGLAWRRIA